MRVPELVDLDIRPPIDVDYPDFTITLSVGDAIKLKEFLAILEQIRLSADV